MTGAAWLQLGFLIALVALSTPLLGSYMARIYSGGPAPGDRIFVKADALITFDNRRVLHGRRGFDASSGSRHLQCCYLEGDELACRLRVLERRKEPA